MYDLVKCTLIRQIFRLLSLSFNFTSRLARNIDNEAGYVNLAFQWCLASRNSEFICILCKSKKLTTIWELLSGRAHLSQWRIKRPLQVLTVVFLLAVFIAGIPSAGPNSSGFPDFISRIDVSVCAEREEETLVAQISQCTYLELVIHILGVGVEPAGPLKRAQ